MSDSGSEPPASPMALSGERRHHSSSDSDTTVAADRNSLGPPPPFLEIDTQGSADDLQEAWRKFESWRTQALDEIEDRRRELAAEAEILTELRGEVIGGEEDAQNPDLSLALTLDSSAGDETEDSEWGTPGRLTPGNEGGTPRTRSGTRLRKGEPKPEQVSARALWKRAMFAQRSVEDDTVANMFLSAPRDEEDIDDLEQARKTGQEPTPEMVSRSTSAHARKRWKAALFGTPRLASDFPASPAQSPRPMSEALQETELQEKKEPEADMHMHSESNDTTSADPRTPRAATARKRWKLFTQQIKEEGLADDAILMHTPAKEAGSTEEQERMQQEEEEAILEQRLIENEQQLLQQQQLQQQAASAEEIADEAAPDSDEQTTTMLGTVWVVHYDDSGDPYYYSTENGETQWDMPLDLVQAAQTQFQAATGEQVTNSRQKEGGSADGTVASVERVAQVAAALKLLEQAEAAAAEALAAAQEAAESKHRTEEELVALQRAAAQPNSSTESALTAALAKAQEKDTALLEAEEMLQAYTAESEAELALHKTQLVEAHARIVQAEEDAARYLQSLETARMEASAAMATEAAHTLEEAQSTDESAATDERQRTQHQEAEERRCAQKQEQERLDAQRQEVDERQHLQDEREERLRAHGESMRTEQSKLSMQHEAVKSARAAMTAQRRELAAVSSARAALTQQRREIQALQLSRLEVDAIQAARAALTKERQELQAIKTNSLNRDKGAGKDKGKGKSKSKTKGAARQLFSERISLKDTPEHGRTSTTEEEGVRFGTVRVQVPREARPGEMLQVTLESGHEVNVLVPKGAAGGDLIEVRVKLERSVSSDASPSSSRWGASPRSPMSPNLEERSLRASPKARDFRGSKRTKKKTKATSSYSPLGPGHSSKRSPKPKAKNQHTGSKLPPSRPGDGRRHRSPRISFDTQRMS